MGIQKTFKALSDSTRREILELLKEGAVSAGDIGGASGADELAEEYARRNHLPPFGGFESRGTGQRRKARQICLL